MHLTQEERQLYESLFYHRLDVVDDNTLREWAYRGMPKQPLSPAQRSSAVQQIRDRIDTVPVDTIRVWIDYMDPDFRLANPSQIRAIILGKLDTVDDGTIRDWNFLCQPQLPLTVQQKRSAKQQVIGQLDSIDDELLVGWMAQSTPTGHPAVPHASTSHTGSGRRGRPSGSNPGAVPPHGGGPTSPPPPASGEPSGGGAVGRREVLGWLLMAIAGGTAGWLIGDNHEKDLLFAHEAYKDAVGDAADDMQDRLYALSVQANAVELCRTDVQNIVNHCGHEHARIAERLASWTSQQRRVRELYARMQAIDKFFVIMPTILDALASTPELAIRRLGIDIPLGDVIHLRDGILGVKALLDDALPREIIAATDFETEAVPWFSRTSDTNLRERLLNVVGQEFCPEVHEFARMFNAFDDEWGTYIVKRISDAASVEEGKR